MRAVSEREFFGFSYRTALYHEIRNCSRRNSVEGICLRDVKSYLPRHYLALIRTRICVVTNMAVTIKYCQKEREKIERALLKILSSLL